MHKTRVCNGIHCQGKDHPETEEHFYRRRNGAFRSPCKRCYGKNGAEGHRNCADREVR